MVETVYNITIPSTSAILTYSPYVTDNANSGGWQSLCPAYVAHNDTNSWICDPDSAHTTSSFKASFELSFDGVGVYLIGNTTNNLGYDISLDGVPFPGHFRSDIQSLFSSFHLKPGPHTISLTVRRPVLADNPGSVTLKEVVISAGTGRSGATVTKKVLDDNDPSIGYHAPPGGNWTVANAYPQATQPEGVANTLFHDSYWTNATATIGFKGAGISVYGACYSHSRYAGYSASIDGTEEIQYDGTRNLYSIGGDVKQRAGNCLRYFKAGLDADKDHQLVLKVKDMGRLAVDWVEIFTVDGGQQIDSGKGGTEGDSSTGLHNNSTVAIIAGAISGGIVLMLALLTTLICLKQKRPNPQDILTPVPNNRGVHNQQDTSFISTPFTPALPHIQTGAYGASVTPPWPQPQTPVPSVVKQYSSGTQGGLSYSLGGAPLASPGLSTMSSYTESGGSGSGWPDSTGYQTTPFNYTATVGPSISRLPAHSGGVVSPVPEPGVAYAGDGPMGGAMFAPEAGSATNLEPGHQMYVGGVASSFTSPSSPCPPAYEKIPTPGVAKIAREKRVR
ncbi:hypothetical protein OPQ81_005476 [Rhizoctonia solani]|nr:hypothetical protein OPQ81_005476 [Rhizoctonia solani]